MENESFVPTTEDFSEDQWWLILWSFITDLPVNEWNDFAHDLIYKDRFSSSHRVVDVIKSFSNECTNTIKKGQILYRARIYHQDPLREFLSNVFDSTTEKKDSYSVNNDNYYNMQLASIAMAIEQGTSRGKEIVDAYYEWKSEEFKGYNSTESGSPPAEIGSAGRINPAKIRYLYLAEDSETAIYEVRPTISQFVSVASFKTVEDIKIYDLACEMKSQDGENSEKDYLLFDEIQKRFSEPNTGDAFKYLPTQYLGEVIKQMGFDGIRFRSSLKNDGINVVMFDETKCKAFCSDIVKVSDIELKFEKPNIYQLEELLKREKDRDK